MLTGLQIQQHVVVFSGYMFFMYSSLVSWSFIQQCTVALSSMEAKYMSLLHAMREAISIWYFVTSLNLPIPWPFLIYCNNKDALDIANSNSVTSRSKHIDIHYHFICEHLQSGSFQTLWIPMTNMVADILTKLLVKELHYKFINIFGIVTLP